jgi:diacylglycerol kinase (ATP)
MQQNPREFSLAARARSFKHALRGIACMLKGQVNARIHAALSLFVVGLGFGVGLSVVEWCFVVTAIAMVWMAEAFNTAIELVCDLASPEFHPLVKLAKDIAAGAVLLAAIGASVIGLLVFLPYFSVHFSG